MNSYLNKTFPYLKIEKPLFYNWGIGLRFEIGPDELEIGEEYFNIAFKRAISIFEFVFSPEDDVEIIYQQFSDGRSKIRKNHFIYKQITNISAQKIKHTDVRNIYDLEHKSYCWKRLNTSGISLKNIKYKNILLALINTDFPDNRPSISGECYFINRSKNIILNLYDDRGMDVISNNKESLISLYKSKSEWLLNYNRKKMDALFSN